jgi:hypothetical protein
VPQAVASAVITAMASSSRHSSWIGATAAAAAW